MPSNIRNLRRVFIGKDVGVIFGLLVLGSVLVGAFVPWYLAVVIASSLRNVYLHQLGSGLLLYTVAVLVLYLQAVVITAVYQGSRILYQEFQERRDTADAI